MNFDNPNIEYFFCNRCRQKTRHFIRGEHSFTEEINEVIDFSLRFLIVECCGCEYFSFVRKTHHSENVGISYHPITRELVETAIWEEDVFPPVSYRAAPPWFEDLPDSTLRDVSEEIYKSLQTESHYLATFGARTLIDRLIVLTVGDQGNFFNGLKALQESEKISTDERKILSSVIDAGSAAAHRGWAPTKEQLATILDTIEGLIHRLLVLPKLVEELDEAVPRRGENKTKNEKKIVTNQVITVQEKIKKAPKGLQEIYNQLVKKLTSLGEDITVQPKKHYMAFRRHRNFASVQIYNQSKLIRVYLNLDPDKIEINSSYLRDVRQIGHYGTGNLEATIKSKQDIEKISTLIEKSYELS